MRWLTRWWPILLRDLLLTGTGMFMLLSQVFAARPSDVVLVAGLALTVPAMAGHATALLSPPPHVTGASSPPGASSSGSSSEPSPGDASDE
ncbi:MAG: hypothetical protein ACLQI7_08420 [Streptosporangiaceae bacterium]